MQALVLEQGGESYRFKLDTTHPKPTVEGHKDSVLVQVAYCGLNPADWKIAAFNMAKPGAILGLDVSGVVVASSSDSHRFKAGDRVMYHGSMAWNGGLEQFTLVPEHALCRVPDEVSLQDAAALPCAGITAYQCLIRKCHLQKSDAVLINGASGGVGGFALQLASKVVGCQKIIAVCRESNAQYVKGLGATDVIDYTKEDIVARAKELTGGKGVDVVLDTLGPDSALSMVKAMKFNGQIACIMGLPDTTKIPAFATGISIHEVILGGFYSHGTVEQQHDLAVMGEELLELVKKGEISATVSDVVSGLASAPDAFHKLEHHQLARGKLVIKINQ